MARDDYDDREDDVEDDFDEEEQGAPEEEGWLGSMQEQFGAAPWWVVSFVVHTVILFLTMLIIVQSMKIAIVNAGVKYAEGQGWEKSSPQTKNQPTKKIDGIEPPGGSPSPPPDPKTYIRGVGKRMKVDYNAMDKDIEKYIQGMQERK